MQNLSYVHLHLEKKTDTNDIFFSEMAYVKSYIHVDTAINAEIILPLETFRTWALVQSLGVFASRMQSTRCENDHREVVHLRKAIILVQPSSDATWQTTSFEEMSVTESTIVPEDTSKFPKHADLLIVCLQHH